MTEVDVRAMRERATPYEPGVVAGRFMIHTVHEHRPWIVIVEPDADAKLLIVVTPYDPAPRHRRHPDVPLRGFVRGESCGRGLTGSWSKGHSGSRFEMTLREGSARAGLQVALEAAI